MPVVVTKDIVAGVIAIPHGWGHKGTGGWRVANSAGGANVNRLMSSAPEDLESLAGMARLTGVPVRVEPVIGDATEVSRAAESYGPHWALRSASTRRPRGRLAEPLGNFAHQRPREPLTGGAEGVSLLGSMCIGSTSGRQPAPLLPCAYFACVVEEYCILRYCWTLRWLPPAHPHLYLTLWSTPESLTAQDLNRACSRTGQVVSRCETTHKRGD